MSSEKFNPISFSVKKEMKSGEKTEKTEFIKPELSIELNKEVLNSLAERYPDHREMFDRFSRLPPIKFERGKVNFLFGPNGSGKSTLANAVFLAAEVAQLTQKALARSKVDFRTGKDEPTATAEEAHKNALTSILHPDKSSRYIVAELIGMAAAPRLVEEGALTLSQFRAREGYGGKDTELESDTPIIHRIAVQDMLGEERRQEERYLFERRHPEVSTRKLSETQSSYAESGGSARQMIEEKLRRQFEIINPGSIVVMDEAAFGLSPKRQEEYIQMLEQFAREKDLIVIAPENSGYAYDSASMRIDLETPERGLYVSETRDSEARAGVAPIESQEVLPEPTMEFALDHDKLKQLAESNPQFKPMLEAFDKLPPSFGFGPGKTEIFADNGGGKTTLLGVMYLLMQIEGRIDDSLKMASFMRRKEEDKETVRKGEVRSLVTNPSQTGDKVFIESLGFARELIASGAITLKNQPNFPKQRRSTMEGVSRVMWMNLLDVSGEIKNDNFNIIGYSEARDIAGIAEEIKKMRPERIHGSTRQTAETLLMQTIQHMPEGGFLFVDEIDGGISPGRQLRISDTVHKLAREKRITVVATSNSYEGFKYRLTPSFDLSVPEQGVASARYRLTEAA